MSETLRQVSLALAVAATFASPLVSAEVKVFLLAGQSNMDGRGNDAQLPPPLQAPQTDVLFFDQTGPLTTLQPGSGSDFGPEITFGRTMADSFASQSFALVKYADGGTSLADDWNPTSGASYNGFQNTVSSGIAALQAAGHTTTLAGMLWHQGEADSNSAAHAANYEANLTSFIGAIRGEYGANLPFYIGEIRRNNALDNMVADAQVSVAAADPLSSFVPANDLSFGDTTHLDAAGQIALGERYAHAHIGFVQTPEPAGGALGSLALLFLLAARHRRPRNPGLPPNRDL